MVSSRFPIFLTSVLLRLAKNKLLVCDVLSRAHFAKDATNCISNSFFLTPVSAAILRARYFLFQKAKSMVSSLVLFVFGTAQSTYEI